MEITGEWRKYLKRGLGIFTSHLSPSLLIIIIIIIIITQHKPKIIIRDNKKGTCMSIDVAIYGDRNVIKKETEKILKYKDLITEIQRMWNVKAEVIPVILGATGTISKSLRQYRSNIPGKHEINP
jgi:uncharacterized protein YoxC